MKTINILYILCGLLFLVAVFCVVAYATYTPQYKFCENETTNNLSIVYITEECEPETIFIPKCTAYDRTYYDEVLEERQELLEEYKQTGFPEVRPSNYVPYCDRAGVVC